MVSAVVGVVGVGFVVSPPFVVVVVVCFGVVVVGVSGGSSGVSFFELFLELLGVDGTDEDSAAPPVVCVCMCVGVCAGFGEAEREGQA